MKIKVKVYLEEKDTEELVELKGNKVKDVLDKLNIDSGIVIVANKDNEVVTGDYVLGEDERIKINPVISGG